MLALSLREAAPGAHRARAIAGGSRIDLRAVVHDEGTVDDDRLALFRTRQDQQARDIHSLEGRLAAAAEREGLPAVQQRLVAVGAHPDAAGANINERLVGDRQIEGDHVL